MVKILLIFVAFLENRNFTSFSSLMRFLKAYLQPPLYFSSCVTIRLQSNMHQEYCCRPKRVEVKHHNKCTFQRHYQSDNICFSDCIHLKCGNTGYDFSSPSRGVSGYLKLGGQVVMRRTAAAWKRLLFCQKLGGQLPHPVHPSLTPLPKIQN